MMRSIKFIFVMYNLRFCTSCNLYKKSVQIATCANSLYKLQLVQAPYVSVEQCILKNLSFKIHKMNISYLHE